MITKYGYDVFFTVSGICLIVVLVSFFLIEPRVLKFGLIVFTVIFYGFVVNFFRDPDRVTPPGENLVISPADGTIIQIKQIAQPEFMEADAVMISIFMSPINVHVNRNPVSGTVAHVRYVEGEYFAAFEDKASEKNEQMIIGIDHAKGKVLFKQIAGFVARRIVCTLKVGDQVRAGERFGMIKFGSRVDVFIPRSAAAKVQVGDRVAAGESILAEFQEQKRGRE